MNGAVPQPWVILGIALALSIAFLAGISSLAPFCGGKKLSADSGNSHEELRRTMVLLGDDIPAAFLGERARLALAKAREAEDGERWLREARAFAERCVIKGGRSEASFRAWVEAEVAWIQARRSEKLAARPEAGPVAWDAAIAEAEESAARFSEAHRLRDSWPEALRNAERAKVLAERFRRQRAEDRRRKQAAPKKRKNPLTKEEKRQEKARPKLAGDSKSSAQIQSIERRLRARERARREQRRKTRAGASEALRGNENSLEDGR